MNKKIFLPSLLLGALILSALSILSHQSRLSSTPAQTQTPPTATFTAQTTEAASATLTQPLSPRLSPQQNPQVQEAPSEFPEGVRELAQKFFALTPRQSALKGLSDHDVHITPAPVLRAGENLAFARDFFMEHPQPPEVEMKFYLKCAVNSEMFDSVRAVCAARASQKYLQLTGHNISPLIFGQRIARLRDQIEI
jgi:hypothetical protein